MTAGLARAAVRRAWLFSPRAWAPAIPLRDGCSTNLGEQVLVNHFGAAPSAREPVVGLGGSGSQRRKVIAAARKALRQYAADVELHNPLLCRTQCQRSFYGFSERSGEHCHGDRRPNVTICQGPKAGDALIRRHRYFRL